MTKFEIKDAKVTELENGNILYERTFVEEIPKTEFDKFKKNTEMNVIALENNIQRLKAQIEATPVMDEELAKLSELHKKAMEAANIQLNIEDAKVKLVEAERSLALNKANKEAIDLAFKKK